jgi:phosphatidylglycerophosphate synthase
VLGVYAGALAVVVVVAAAAQIRLGLSDAYWMKAAAMFAIVAIVGAMSIEASHPFTRFGAANLVTTARAGLVALIAALVNETATSTALLAATAASLIIAMLDGVDGYVARRNGLSSAFGARFDMETDALLILALSSLAWQQHKAGAWILAAGLLRYLFVAGGRIAPRLRRPLLPSSRRKAICVMQMLGLAVIVLPQVVPPISVWLSATLVAALVYSFAVDVAWLWRAGSQTADQPTGGANRRWMQWGTLAAAVWFLNASLTFVNLWPTPAVTWTGEWSIELAATMAAVIVIARWRGGALTPRATRGLAGVWLLLVFGRYASVTAPALWGRELNFYWDLRFLPDVVAMLLRAVPGWMAVAAVVASTALIALMFTALKMGWARIATATERPPEARMLGAVIGLALMLFVLQQASARTAAMPLFSRSVSATYVNQMRFLMTAMSARPTLPASPAFESDLKGVQGADVILLFLESYGAIAFDRPEMAGALVAPRRDLERAIDDAGYGVVSAFVESPTFGGSSWFAHITLMSGIEVRDPDTNALLMTARRETLPAVFARRGYRSVAIMPGLWYPWPEGAFYGFADVYTGDRLHYRGAPFGWWQLPDQFTFAKLDALELDSAPRPPLFVFYPTVSTHTPFAPTPPYQPDWPRMLSERPYDDPQLEHAYAEGPDWMNLGPSYVAALQYAYETLAGYLRRHAGRDLVIVAIGDHQPPALVSGEHAPWEVPVHIIASRRVVLERLLRHGFRAGLTPLRPCVGPMHALTPVLLDAFSKDGDESARVRTTD